MNEWIYYTHLFDFYGGLLNKKHQAFFRLYYFENWTLQEIGDHFGISRQAVNNLIKRTHMFLQKYEDSIGLVNQFYECKKHISVMENALVAGDIEESKKILQHLKQELKIAEV